MTLLRIIAILSGLTVGPPATAQTVFDLIASGPREQPSSEDVRCGILTMQFDFYDQNRRMSLSYTDDILDYEGTFRSRGDYTVLEHLDGALLLLLDDESRLDANGQPVNWILRVRDNGETCWQRADRSILDCSRITVPCPTIVPLS